MRALCNGVSGSRIVLLYNGTQFHIYVRAFASSYCRGGWMHPVCSGIFIKRNRPAERYAYYHTPSADNLPGLQSLQMENLRELKGYKRGQLISVWDDPVRKVSPEQDIWKLDGDQYLLVTYKSNGTVEDAEIIIP